MSFSASELLFVERAMANGDVQSLSEDQVADTRQIARKLDELALGIEPAAARGPRLGLHELAARFDDNLTLLSRGRRTAAPRHQTLSAMLEWSYQLLSITE
ncbi:hypothetical protein ACFFWD_02075 [Bradyrhizobium erythrophlei]|uniref:hypothetical protein n=1 Tax=Bradyrhizobium erythrophlei TaxID=1437360 RepID=UPI0035E5A2EA